MNHYSFRYIYHLVYMAFSINWSWSLHADEKKGGDSFSHTNRGGTLECRWRCHIHLHHSGKLWVFNLGLDRIVQGERETERKKRLIDEQKHRRRQKWDLNHKTSGDYISVFRLASKEPLITPPSLGSKMMKWLPTAKSWRYGRLKVLVLRTEINEY